MIWVLRDLRCQTQRIQQLEAEVAKLQKKESESDKALSQLRDAKKTLERFRRLLPIALFSYAAMALPPHHHLPTTSRVTPCVRTASAMRCSRSSRR